MKSSLLPILTFTIAVFVVQSVSVQPVAAQEKLFGKGRFMKRMFRDLAPPPKSAKPASKKGQLQLKQPTFATRPAQNAQPTLADQSSRSRNTKLRSTQPARSELNRKSAKPLPKPSEAADRDALPTRSNAKATLAFGMLVMLQKDKLYVAQLDPEGNAAAAGVRIGDQLVAGGGIDFESMADYNGIGDILEDGDQLEFEVLRGGREREMMIVYGEVPKDQANAMLESRVEHKTTRDSSQRRSTQRPTVNQINTRANSSFMPNRQNVEVPKRTQGFSPNNQQTSGRSSSSQTIRRQQQEIQQLRYQLEQMKRRNVNGPRLQLPPSAESVLN